MFRHKICRLCLRQSPICFSVFENNITGMLGSLTSKTVTEDIEYSKYICFKCLLSLKLAYSFQQKIKKSEEQLNEQLSYPLKIKQEPYHFQTKSIIINEKGDVKTDETVKDLVKLCDNNCIICGIYVDDASVNDHVRNHLNQKKNSTQPYHKQLSRQVETDEQTCSKCGTKFRYKSLFEIHNKTACSMKQGLKGTANMLLASKKRKKPFAMGKIGDENAKQVFKLGLRSSKAIQLLLGTGKAEDYTCSICFKKFTNRKTFLGHSHKTKKCHVCDRKVSNNSFKRHVEDHSREPQVCHLCGATLQNKSSLVTHIFYSHNNLRYKCDDCGKLFKKKHARDLHKRKDHIGKPTHYCDTCGKGFYAGQFLQKHIKMKHLKMRPHICDFCKKGFSSHYALKTHRRQHTNETPYKCEVCGDGFRQNVSLKAHRKSKHNIVEPKVCSCKVCGKGFASDVALYAHKRLH